MRLARVTLYFPEKYIADPYFPEREELINIQKNSGMNRARSEQKREDSLKEYLRRNGYTLEHYALLERLARAAVLHCRRWHDHSVQSSVVRLPN